MKRSARITVITLSSVLGTLLIAIIIVCNIIFSPRTLTPIVRNNIDRFISCKTDFDTVDLSFFSSFPSFSINLSNFSLVNPTLGAQSDTLVHVDNLSASVNVFKFLFSNSLVIKGLQLDNASANLFTDSVGRTNFDILVGSGDDEEKDTTEAALFDMFSLHNISLNNVSASYVDEVLGVDARINNISASINGELSSANGNIDSDLNIGCITANYSDSTDVFANINNFNLVAKGELRDNHYTGNVSLSLPQLSFALNNDTLINSLPISLSVPAEVNFDLMHFNLKDVLLDIAGSQLKLNGVTQVDNDGINMNVRFSTNQWIIEDILNLVPKSYANLLNGVSAQGRASFDGSVYGTYNDSVMPLITANVSLSDGSGSYSAIPCSLHDVNASVSAMLDLNKDTVSSAFINNISAKTGTSSLSINGSVNDLLGNAQCDVNLLGNINLPELRDLIPNDIKINMKGRTKADLQAKFSLNDLTDMKIERIKARGKIDYENLHVVYKDSISITDSKGFLDLRLPSPRRNKKFKELAQASFKATDLDIEMLGTMDANLKAPDLTVGIGDFRDTTQYYSANCSFSFDRLTGHMDTINFNIQRPVGNFEMYPSNKNKKYPAVRLSYSNDAIKANMGSFFKIDTKALSFNAHSSYDKDQDNLFLQLNPTFDVDFNDGEICMSDLESPINIPAIKFEFKPNSFYIEDSRIKIQDSDFALSGRLTNLKKFINNKGLLKGELNFNSEQTNIDQLLDLVNGLGNGNKSEAENKAITETPKLNQKQNTEFAVTEEPNPFMVPKKVNIAFNTKINKAVFAGNHIENVAGKLTIKDGVAIVEQMGFTSDAAEMQLTGIYRSERRNHLFCGLDFHLLNIDIKELINMIPSVDTIVPMLKTFEGKAQFHIAAETYLKANYEPKLSTMRAAAAIEGKDLVLLDNKTFSTISKYMMFNKKTKNIVDSLSVEMTVFRNEVDIYPFLISMDKWQAVLSGRHNLDMSFDYHISLTHCPLPVRLGLDVRGTFDDMKFQLVPCKYKALYKPEKQKPTDKRTLALKKLISDSLKENVK